jgi:hypothetical protein
MPAGDPARHRALISGFVVKLLALVLGLAGAGLLAGSARRQLIRTFFRDGPPGPAPALDQPAGPAAGLDRVARVRVLLVDGLGAPAARALPLHNDLCRRGTDIAVDVGFPTVSLAVQAVLWTGRTQQQLGLLYRIVPLAAPPPDAIPARLPGGLALAEDQPFIAGSFGFEMAKRVSGDWTGFTRTARELVAGSTALVLVHVLRVDKAGHQGGSASQAYRAAATDADELLGTLLDAAPPDAHTRWFVLSDHGHRPAGGHGGGEPGVRIVRACIAGGATPLPVPPTSGSTVHLVDLSRALHDSLGLSPSRGSAGRPLAFALDHPGPGRTLPRPGAGRATGAALAFLLVFVLVWDPRRMLRGRRPACWALIGGLLWLPLAYLSILLFRGLPTLSNPMVYPPLGRDIMLAGAPGLLGLALGVLLARPERSGLVASCRVQLAMPASLAAACLVASGGAEALLRGAGSGPPLFRWWTAHASVFLSLLTAASFTLAVVSVLAAILHTLRGERDRPSS